MRLTKRGRSLLEAITLYATGAVITLFLFACYTIGSTRH